MPLCLGKDEEKGGRKIELLERLFDELELILHLILYVEGRSQKDSLSEKKIKKRQKGLRKCEIPKEIFILWITLLLTMV